MQSGRAGTEAHAPRSWAQAKLSSGDAALVVVKTTRERPPDATHWSLATLAKALKLSPRAGGRIWREHELKPHLLRTFKVSSDPQFAAKLEDVIGLYLAALEHGIGLCCDEMSQIQALDRTQSGFGLLLDDLFRGMSFAFHGESWAALSRR